MQNPIKSFVKKNPLLKKIYLNFINFGYDTKNRLPWERVCLDPDWDRQLQKVATSGQRILMATCAGGHLTAIDMETILSVALSLRGASVHALICDGFLPACLMCQSNQSISIRDFAAHGPRRLYCKRCLESGIDAYQTAGIKVHLFSEYVTRQDREKVAMLVDDIPLEQIKSFAYQGLAVGEHAIAGALRYFARGSIDDEKYAYPVAKRYLEASLFSVIVLQKLQHQQKFDTAVFHHGIYVPHGIIGEVFRKDGVAVVNWNVGYRKGTFIFSHQDTYHHTMMAEPVNNWETIRWNSQLEQKVLAYIKNRSRGTRDWHAFLNEPTADISTLGFDSSKPTIGLLTNVCWDAQLHYPANVFENMLEWIIQTVDYFAKKPSLQLIIRVHPAEVTAEIPSRQLVVDELNKSFPILPSNIFVVNPESKMNTYTLMDACNAVIIYGTKTGVELTSFGIPVIVAGEAWIRNKGITIDPTTRREYFEMLDKLPLDGRMNEKLKQRALKYAYHFFFRRMVPVEVVQPVGGFYSFSIDIKNLSDLMPGRNAGLDTICSGILSGREFIYEEDGIDHGMQ